LDEEVGEAPSEEPEPISEEFQTSLEEPPADSIAEQEGEEEHDVLEETPDFLRDNPDDDELWFEQGEPKDFDL
jgi:hypothetical protein